MGSRSILYRPARERAGKVREEEPAGTRSLTGVDVARTLDGAEPRQRGGLRRFDVAHDEDVVEWFVAPPTTLEGIYAAVTRRTLDDRNPTGWVPDQKITVEEALRAYTLSPAFASFDENRKGTLARGKLADLVLIDRDLTSIAPESIRDARISMTVVGGRVVFERQ
jgi:hypothetical protein